MTFAKYSESIKIYTIIFQALSEDFHLVVHVARLRDCNEQGGPLALNPSPHKAKD